MLLALHLPNHVLDGSTVAVTTLAAVAAIAWSLWQLRGPVRNDAASIAWDWAQIGACALAILAAQSDNAPLGRWDVSGHLFGGVLAAALFGPWKGLLILTFVVSVQALVFGDGGTAAWGANVLNMAVLGSAGGYALMRGLERVPGLARGADPSQPPIVAAALAAGISVPLMALAAGVQMAASGTAPLSATLPPLVSWHAAIGLAEGLLTAHVLFVLTQLDPLVMCSGGVRSSATRGWQVAATLGVAALLALAAGTVASTAPDALEHVLAQVAPLGG